MKVVGARLWASRRGKSIAKTRWEASTHVQRTRERVEPEKAEGSSRRVNPEACPKGGGRSLSRALSRAVASSLSPLGVEYSLSEGRPCSARLAHSSKYGFGRRPSGPCTGI